MKTISILGSTGSIGTQTLEVVRQNSDLKVAAISGRNNIKLLAQQILEFAPKLVCIYDENKIDSLYQELKKLSDGSFDKTSIKVVSGMEGLIDVAIFDESDIVVTAIVGMIGIKPTMAAIKAGKDIALANKETLVCAGALIMAEARKQNINIYPVDSEHSAIFQSLQGEQGNSIDEIILTASGGPFRGYTRQMLKSIRLEDALKHPNWSMGQKVTIDSSTLANKGLEVMEAKWLFDVKPEQIQVVIQPQSIIHSAVQYTDGAIIAQLGTPDMKIPIQYALLYPERRFLPGKRVDFFELGQITFEKPDTDVFKALKLAYEAISIGGTMPTVFNAANESAVKKFVSGEISYLDISDMIENEMREHQVIKNPTLDEIICLGDSIMNKGN